MVFSATPCRRAMSGTDAPASCSLRIEMICSSVYRLRFISEPPSGQIIGKSHMLHGSIYRGTVIGSVLSDGCGSRPAGECGCGGAGSKASLAGKLPHLLAGRGAGFGLVALYWRGCKVRPGTF